MKKTRRKKRPQPCPKCGSFDVVPIMYGIPTQKAMDEADRGKIFLGGCCIGERDPQKHCKACGEAFDFEPKPPGASSKRG